MYTTEDLINDFEYFNLYPRCREYPHLLAKHRWRGELLREETNYNTQQIWIKSSHRMFGYFQEMCENSKNLYNTTNFYIRQVFTGLTTAKTLQPLQIEVLNTIEDHIDQINIKQVEAYEKRLANEKKKPKEKQKTVHCNLFQIPDKDNPYIGYNLLDALFKQIDQLDYKALPAQNSQGIMRNVFDNWKSFFASLKDYRENPSKYLGKPKIPTYIKNTMSVASFTNQDCVIKENRFLKFPKTKERLQIGKLGYTNDKLKSVRVIPKHGQFVVEMVFEQEAVEPISETPKRIMTLDLGIDNLATITTNTGKAPVLLKGNTIKSVNQYYNKQRANYYGILRQGKHTKEGQFSSKRLNNLDAVRHRKLKDLFHKASFLILNLAEIEEIDTIIIGQNKGWKQNANMGKRNNQSFVHIPFSLFIDMIRYKAEQVGIREETLLQMKIGAVIESIDFDTLNKQAANYALSGVSQQHLLQKQLEERTQLVSDLRKKTEEAFFATFSLNGEEVDPYSGYPHSIFNYIAAFIWHDNHHKQQINGFLKEKGKEL